VADFTFTPVIPVPNEPTRFNNTSRNATDYTWSFGDGNGSSEVNPTHQYRKTGTYTVCLEARNRGCADTICKQVASDVLTGAELPTAFSPNGDGSNDVFYVRGGAIETSNLKIFNRWGQLVFESSNAPANDPAYGWDGSYKGKQQEMEVYGWVLNVTFIDGSTSQRKGNVTLLR
jgi:gliding motility-associated-like protein